MSRRLDTYVKTPTEVKEYVIDYSKWLGSGETVTSVSTSVKANGFVDPAVTPLTTDDYQINTDGNTITYRAENGDHGETYEVFITITTSAGQVKEDMVMFKVRSLG